MKLHRIVQVLTGTLAAVALVAGPAPAADAATSESFSVDKDYVWLNEGSMISWATGDLDVLHKNGSVQGHLYGKVNRQSSTLGCRSLRVIFTYSDRSPETKDLHRACWEHGALSAPMDLWSASGKNLVKMTIHLMTSRDFTSSLSVVDTDVDIVGDAPDSWGRAERLDHDGFVVNKSTVPVFTGATDWSLRTYSGYGYTATATMARVTGQLAWSDTLGGVRAGVTAIWTYADGSTSRSSSGTVVRGAPPINVDLKSSGTRDALSVRVTIRTYADDTPWSFAGTEEAAAHAGKFGDFGSKP